MKTMKYFLRLNVTLILFAAVVFTGCDDDDDDPAVQLSATTVQDLNSVSARNFTFFSFSNNATVPNSDSASTKWDIGFRGTTIILNGGASGPGQAAGQIVEGIFDELVEAPETGYNTDTQSTKAIVGSTGWYTYTGTTAVPNHTVLPIAGRVLMLKTADGKYAKVEIVSYYQGNPDITTAQFADTNTRPASRYYTLRFVYQPDGTRKLETK